MLGMSWYSSGTAEHITAPVRLWDALKFASIHIWIELVAHLAGILV